MITAVDDRFRREVREYRLRFRCESCASFDDVSGGCGNQYPNAPHREAGLDGASEVVFCKEFELA